MLIGYNTNIRYKGKVYHVQTEDSGPTNPQIVTLLYHQGAILSSKKTNYSHLIGESDFEEKLRNLMKGQHREMIKELKKIVGSEEHERNVEEPSEQGLADPDVREGDVSEGERTTTRHEEVSQIGSLNRSKGLDDILIDYITRRGKR
jgi:hypothetical protein